jgi:uncharacterized protein YjbJ (UPF0337 family)
MDKDRIKGKAKDVAGRIQRQTGEWTGDAETQAKGAAKQAEGKVQNAWGKAKDQARDIRDQAEESRQERAEERERNESNLDEEIAPDETVALKRRNKRAA